MSQIASSMNIKPLVALDLVAESCATSANSRLGGRRRGGHLHSCLDFWAFAGTRPFGVTIVKRNGVEWNGAVWSRKVENGVEWNLDNWESGAVESGEWTRELGEWSGGVAWNRV